MVIHILSLQPHHWDRVRAIYLDGLSTGQAGFETRAPSWADWDAAHLEHSRLVAIRRRVGKGGGREAGRDEDKSDRRAAEGGGRQKGGDGDKGGSRQAAGPEVEGGRPAADRKQGEDVLGWVALSPVSTRRCYAGVAEVSIYVASETRGLRIGTRLLNEVVRTSEAAGIWTLQAVVFPENITSVRLHERCGFRVVGRRERIAQRDGIWHDTLLLERRSGTVGQDPG